MFTKEIRKMTIEYHEKLAKADAKIQEWIDNDRFQGSPYQKEEITKAKNERHAVLDEGVKALDGINKKFQEALSDRYTPHGEDLTDDAKIFSSAIELSDEEIREYARRYQGNLTMLRLVSDYAKKRNPKVTEVIYIPKETKIASADRVTTYCKSALTDELLFNTVIVQDDRFNQICGEELANE